MIYAARRHYLSRHRSLRELLRAIELQATVQVVWERYGLDPRRYEMPHPSYLFAVSSVLADARKPNTKARRTTN